MIVPCLSTNEGNTGGSLESQCCVLIVLDVYNLAECGSVFLVSRLHVARAVQAFREPAVALRICTRKTPLASDVVDVLSRWCFNFVDQGLGLCAGETII